MPTPAQPKFRQMSAFEIFLRTGRQVKSLEEAHQISLKFNPWHDPHNGQFTTSGSGMRSGAGVSGNVARHMTAKPATPFKGAGGSMGGGGSTGSWGSNRQQQTARKPVSPPPIIPLNTKTPEQAKRPAESRPVAANAPEIHHTIERNGYRFDIDQTGRTRSASGQLRLENGGTRSRQAQTQAGGSDRKPTDDGGHYIAARFGGPTARFNHFAQDRNFNRGAYRRIEKGWAESISKGQKVSVSITPNYEGNSQRPDQIVVVWIVDGKRMKRTFANRHGGN